MRRPSKDISRTGTAAISENHLAARGTRREPMDRHRQRSRALEGGAAHPLPRSQRLHLRIHHENSRGPAWADLVCSRQGGRRHRSLCQVLDLTLRCFGKAAGINSPYAGGDLLEDSSGAFWFHSDREIYHWSPKSSTSIPVGSRADQIVDGIQSLALDPQGRLLIGTAESASGWGIARLEDGVVRPAELPGIDACNLPVQQLLFDCTPGHGEPTSPAFR
jgi:hypothetical protein